MKSVNFFYATVLLMSALAVNANDGTKPKLWYNQPAKKWETEALPIGNGRLGAMLFGDINTEHIQFNEQSLWSGDNNWDGAYTTGDHGFGSYRNFGDITINFDKIGQVNSYSRSLAITTGIHNTTFTANGITVKRDAFASHPDQVLVFKYTANKKAAFSGKISLASAQGAISTAQNNELSFAGILPNQLKYAASLRLLQRGGTVRTEGNSLVFENCNTLTIYVNARTNYKPDYVLNWRGADPMPLIQQEQTAAQKLSYQKLIKRHIADITRLTKAATINIGTSADSILALATDIRLKKYIAGAADPDLEETLFQYGRYLLVSSSRKGGLPANLQGLWNDSNTPAWASDYHSNINIQMNYWGAETTGLTECHVPLIDFIVAAEEPSRMATRKAFGERTRGWTARTSQSIFGGHGWEWNIPASAWYAQHVFEHWAFTMDKAYLAKTAYPILKEICQYWEDRLKQTSGGTLVVPMGWSPEHGPREDGVMHDQQLVWDLFQNYLDAAKVLGIDVDYQATVANMQQHLAPNKIGSWGQLQEWQTDRDRPDDQHRHTSHLFGVYPGRQITLSQTPALAHAAIISLRSRSGNYGVNRDKPFTVASTVGDSRRSWSWPWRGALWARLGEGEKAAIMIRGLLTYNTSPNLLTTHPPFQIDGNLGIIGAVPEMLMQSHAGEIHLLPAIPKAWGIRGSFTGLKARGGFTVSCTWQNGKVISYKISSVVSQKVKVRANNELREIISTRI